MRGRVLQTLAVISAATLVGCPSDDDVSLPVPTITAVEVIPEAVQLGPGIEFFTLHARAIDQWGFKLPAVFTWIPTGGASIESQNGDTAVFKTGGATGDLTVEVRVGTLADVASIYVTAPGVNADIATSLSEPEPAGAMFRGLVSGNCRVLNEVVAFLGGGVLGYLDGQANPTCGAFGLVAQVGMRLHTETPTWNGGRQEIAGGNAPPEVVKVQVWTSEPITPALKAMVDGELDLVNAILRTNRAGFTVDRDPTLHESSMTPIPAECSGPEYKTDPAWMVSGTGAFPDDALVIFYTSSVTGGNGLFSRRGLTCRPNVILINSSDHVPSTLVHEIGHAMGLVEPWGLTWGHTNQWAGMRASQNIMWDAASTRIHLTLGQVFRMHKDWRSWIVPDGLGVDCGCRPYQGGSGGCPMLTADFRMAPPPLPPVACTSVSP